MHPELLSSLATEHRRDLTAAVCGGRAPAARAGWRAPRLALPRYRLSWTRTRLAAVSGSRRGTSLVIVISATRAAGPGSASPAVGPSTRGSLVRAL
jgi:hypothetical protein